MARNGTFLRKTAEEKTSLAFRVEHTRAHSVWLLLGEEDTRTFTHSLTQTYIPGVLASALTWHTHVHRTVYTPTIESRPDPKESLGHHARRGLFRALSNQPTYLPTYLDVFR